MNALAFRHVAQVGLCRNVTVFRDFLTRGADFLAGFFIIYLFFFAGNSAGWGSPTRLSAKCFRRMSGKPHILPRDPP
jgi:hypothetical protein